MAAREYVCTFVNGELVPMSELVRCRDCKYWKANSMEHGLDCHTPQDYYCADGTRREHA